MENLLKMNIIIIDNIFFPKPFLSQHYVCFPYVYIYLLTFILCSIYNKKNSNKRLYCYTNLVSYPIPNHHHHHHHQHLNNILFLFSSKTLKRWVFDYKNKLKQLMMEARFKDRYNFILVSINKKNNMFEAMCKIRKSF